MTAGLAQSFYDFYSAPAASYRAGNYPYSDTGDGGWFVWAYTAQLGGGFSATISAEELRRTTQIIDQNSISATTGGSIMPGGFCYPVGRDHRQRWRLRWLAVSGHRRQSAGRSGLG